MGSSSRAGTLSVVDQRTSLNYELPICERGSLRAADFSKIKAGGDGKGLKLYDPGFFHTAPIQSAICHIDGNVGTLRYRGRFIEDLVCNFTFMEAAYLLCYGVIPNKEDLSMWESAICNEISRLPKELLAIVNSLPSKAPPMKKLVTALYGLSSLYPDAHPALAGQDVYKDEKTSNLQIIRIMGKSVSLAGGIFLGSKPLLPPNNNLSFSQMVFYIFQSGGNPYYLPNPKLVNALDKVFTIVAEHELGPSTAAALHFSSSGGDIYTAMAGALSATFGQYEAGAIESVLDTITAIASVEGVEAYVQKAISNGYKVPGFGHRIYKTYDPRLKLIKLITQEVHSIVPANPLVEVADALEASILSNHHFKSRNIYPNVTFRLGLLLSTLGFPSQYFVMICAIGRIIGHLAHWKELTMTTPRIMRPQQWYTGKWLQYY